MSTGANLEPVEAARGNVVPLEHGTHGEKSIPVESPSVHNADKDLGKTTSDRDLDGALRGPNGEEYPTKEDLATLTRVRGDIDWVIYTIAFCELCERFAYYGTTAVCKYCLAFLSPLAAF
jgi:POT family proton-dependent oligopeptide transporter